MSKQKSEIKFLITGISILSALGLWISIASKDLLLEKAKSSTESDPNQLNLEKNTIGLPPLPTLAVYQGINPDYSPRVVSAQTDQPVELREVQAPAQPTAPARVQNPVVDEVVVGGNNSSASQGGGNSSSNNSPAPVTTTQSS